MFLKCSYFGERTYRRVRCAFDNVSLFCKILLIFIKLPGAAGQHPQRPFLAWSLSIYSNCTEPAGGEHFDRQDYDSYCQSVLRIWHVTGCLRLWWWRLWSKMARTLCKWFFNPRLFPGNFGLRACVAGAYNHVLSQLNKLQYKAGPSNTWQLKYNYNMCQLYKLNCRGKTIKLYVRGPRV